MDLLIAHPLEETQGDVAMEALLEGQHASEVKEPQIETPITEPQIPHSFEAQEKERPTLEEPYVPSIETPQGEDVTPTSLEEEEETPIAKEHTSDSGQILHEFPQDIDTEAPYQVPTEQKVELEDAKPSLEEVPTSVELPTSHSIEETEGDVGLKTIPLKVNYPFHSP